MKDTQAVAKVTAERRNLLCGSQETWTERFPPKSPSFAFFLQALDYLTTSLGFVSLVRLRISGSFPSGRSQGLAGAGDAFWDAGSLQALF